MLYTKVGLSQLFDKNTQPVCMCVSLCFIDM